MPTAIVHPTVLCRTSRGVLVYSYSVHEIDKSVRICTDQFVPANKPARHDPNINPVYATEYAMIGLLDTTGGCTGVIMHYDQSLCTSVIIIIIIIIVIIIAVPVSCPRRLRRT